MKKILIVTVVIFGFGLFAAARWTLAQHSDGGSGHGNSNSGGTSHDDDAYQKAMDEARKQADANSTKAAEDAVNKALMYRPNDPSALALKARITKKIKGMTYTGTNEQGLQEYKHNKTGMIFVLIPGGTLVIEEADNGSVNDGSGAGSGSGGGSGSGDNSGNNSNKNRRELKVDDFLMSKYETPQGVWINFMNDNPSFFRKGKDYPVEQVTHENCQSFCKKTDLRLPSWVEWEYSARAGSVTPYFWGKEPNEEYFWYNKNSVASTHPITTRKGNGFGLYNMLGNVMEWTNDLFKDRVRGKAEDTEPGQGEVEGNKEKYGMLRGGAWDQPAELCQSASYIQVLPTAKDKNAGFRCAKDINKP
ncbi:MAG: formylglycine-generating enzyme family protein [Planctomycetes bacterium]|nr:formylglycine-generating enzyme family protein [Planctomycetota bacterium]